MLMGDAGSRALGFYIAIIAMKTGHPLAYILLALVLILDGGLGLVKVSLKRFLKISILTNTRTPCMTMQGKIKAGLIPRLYLGILYSR